MLKNNWTIGVTGAAGFIGSHLCERLLIENFKVIAVDDLSKGSQENIKSIISNKNFLFHKLDITNTKRVQLVFKNVNVIIHLAASKIPRYGGRYSTLITNTKGTENLLNVAKKNKAKFIFISTSDVYGKNPELPFSEKSNLVLGSSEIARWSYAVSKIFDEHLCFGYWEEYKVPFVILRLFGVYGPRQHRSWWGGPQALFINKIITGEEIEIHGNGHQTRTFIYINDVVEAFIKSISSKKANNQIVNIGGTHEISIIELGRLISKLLKKPLKIKKVPYQSFTGKKYEDVRRRIPSIKKAKELLNWEPKVSLTDGLKETISWHLKTE